MRERQPTSLYQYCQNESIRLLLLFGSRAKGTATNSSDSDLGVLLQRGMLAQEQLLRVSWELGQVCDLPRVHLVDLRRASGLLKHAAAESAMVLYQAEEGAYQQFRVLAAKQYADERYDLEPLYKRYLEESAQRNTDVTR